MKTLFFAFLIFLPRLGFGFESTTLNKLAIQDGGRVKPFDTFARESAQLLTGSTHFRGKNPVEVVLSWLIIPDEWENQKFIEVNFQELKRDLGLKESEKYFSPHELAHNEKLMQIFGKISESQRNQKKLSPYLQKAARIGNQLSLFQAVVSGKALRFVPIEGSEDWKPLSEAPEEYQQLFMKMSSAYVQSIKDGNGATLDAAAREFRDLARSRAGDKYLGDAMVERELWYNSFHPFRVAWICYLFAALFLIAALVFSNKILTTIAGVGVSVGLAVNITGFVVRCLIAERPPVTNMYESVIWVSSGIVFFGAIFTLIYRRSYILLAATLTSTVGMIVADSLPAALDQSIRPLEPVLRSNYWLTIHVLTITLSYAAFGLALGIANFALGYSIFKPSVAAKQQQVLGTYVYRVLQVGVVLLTAGTILGGVWADYSWGRFWGWDPKETWALIALLFYVAVLHGRLTGWITIFRLHVCTIICFTAVMMAWYGVNFVLGVGLHSYGFGAGGIKFVGLGVLIQWLYVAVASIRQGRIKERAA